MVAIDVRPNLLYGELDTILLSNVKQARPARSSVCELRALARQDTPSEAATRAASSW